MPHDQIRCEPCNCSFHPNILQQHQKGRQHLRNVLKTAKPSESPPATTIQSSPPADISPSVVDTSTRDTDPRVRVSGEDGLDFFVEGSGTSANPSFSSTNHITIEKTNITSGLSLQSITLRPSLGSGCEKFDYAIHSSHNLSTVSPHLWLAS
jgi:hypothetical protein